MRYAPPGIARPEPALDSPADYYDRIADRYREDRFGNSYGRFIDAAERRWLDARLARRPEGPVLDLGCGDGRLSDRADIGIDISHRMLRHARGGGLYARATGTALPFADGAFAAIFSLHVAMHLPEAELRRWLAEAHRCLRPGGLLLIDVPGRLRRRLRPHRSGIAAWHGHSAYDAGDVVALAPGFALIAADGLLILPLHRMPKRWRAACAGIDRTLCRLLRPLASYQLLCLRRA